MFLGPYVGGHNFVGHNLTEHNVTGHSTGSPLILAFHIDFEGTKNLDIFGILTMIVEDTGRSLSGLA